MSVKHKEIIRDFIKEKEILLSFSIISDPRKGYGQGKDGKIGKTPL